MDDEESISVQVEIPREQRNRHTSVISTCEFSYEADDPHNLRLYLCVSEIYLNNLINRKEEPSFKDDLRRRLPSGSILHQEFHCELKQPNGKDEEPLDCQGEIIFVYQEYHGLQLQLRLNNNLFTTNDYLAARFTLSAEEEGARPKTFIFSLLREGVWSTQIDDTDLKRLLKGRLALQVILQRQVVQETGFSGIRNEGNTCYMNSVMQILFFIRMLRKHVVDYLDEGKVLRSLRQVFLTLLDSPKNRSGPADAESLIQAYGRFAQQPRRQQDTHEFLLGFLQELEGECPSLAGLWQGQSTQLVQSMEEDKPYRSQTREDFSSLDLPLEDHKGNTFSTLMEALHHLMAKEKVEDKIQTDDYGKATCEKSKMYTKLPPVLFITLKRYKFKKASVRPTKILADLHYPSSINLSFLMGTPTGEDLQYQLFAVTVHKGQQNNSGHYYSFVNTGQSPKEPHWVRFDDSRVALASSAQVLSFSGGKRRTTTWSSQYSRFIEKEYPSQDTAYVLVYFRKQYFKEYQSVQVTIPRDWALNKRKTRAIEQLRRDEGSKMIEVFVGNLEEGCDWFGDDVNTIPIELRPNEDIVNQLSKLDYNLLGCRVGTVWKVIKAEKKIKQLIEFADLPQTPTRVFDFKRGHRIPDYLLVLPEDTPVYRSRGSSLMEAKRLGLTQIQVVSGKTYRLLGKDSLQDLLNEEQKRSDGKGHIVQKESFMYDWNDYCTMKFQ